MRLEIYSISLKKVRADVLLVTQGLAASRQQAQAMIMAGSVYRDAHTRVEKGGALVPAETRLELKGATNPYVSRGGLKLEGALEDLALQVTDMTCADFGASTGGFSDCLLQRGAKKVYAIDVGYGQLHHKLRQDPRVVALERINARYLKRDDLPEPMDLITIDASFIGLSKLLPAARELCKPDGYVLGMVKPQFEVGPQHLSKKGVVKNEQLRSQAIDKVIADAKTHRFVFKAKTDSRIKGPEGNQETFILLKASP